MADSALGSALIIPESALKKIKEADDKLQKLQDTAKNTASGVTQSFKDMSVGTKPFLDSLDQVIAKLATINASASNASSGISNVGASAGNMNNNITSAAQNIQNMVVQLSKMNGSGTSGIMQAALAFQRLQESAKGASGMNIAELKQEIGSIESTLRDTTQNLTKADQDALIKRKKSLQDELRYQQQMYNERAVAFQKALDKMVSAEQSYNNKQRKAYADRAKDYQTRNNKANTTYQGALDFSATANTLNRQVRAIEYLKEARMKLSQTDADYKRKLDILNAAIEQHNKNLKEAGVNSRALTEQTSYMTGYMSRLAQRMAFAFSVGSIKNFVEQIASVRGQFELSERSLEAILQNKPKADEIFNKTVELAVKSPFRIKDLVDYTRQLSAYRIDELTEMTWEVFSYVMTRNRGQSKTFTGKFFATLNPKRSHWTRIFLDWYIGPDGFIIPERDGVVRYFYCAGPTVKDVVWGMSKREVYEKCKIDIDRKLKTIGGNFGYEVMIKSFVFYQGKLGSNKKMLENNSGYLGSVAASGGRMAQALMEGNFNVDPEEDEDIPIPSQAARDCFVKDPAVNGDKWITIDLADFGKDNTLMLSWNGFHIVNYEIVMHSTPRINAERARLFAASEGVAESHIIYDATAGRYFNDYIPDAIPYISAAKAMGIYYLSAMTIKDLCYLRLSYMIKRGQLTFSDKVANAVYTHQNLKYRVSIQNEFMEECAVVRFDKMQSGKKKLQSKKEMNRNLGKDRSMDLLDPCAMRMYPCLNMEYGSELQEGFRLAAQEVEEKNPNAQSIYDDTLYY
jgi:hypothetical protein